MAILATDNFTVDGGLGANWTTVTGLDDPTVRISKVEEGVAAGANSCAIWSATSFPDDQYGSIHVRAATNNLRHVGVLLRASSADRTGYECYMAGPIGATATLKIDRYNAGALTALAATAADQTVAFDDTFKAEIIGTVISIYIQGILRLSYDDSAAPITSGSVGIRVVNSGTNTTAQLNTFEAGSSVTTITGPGRKHQGFIYARPYL